MTNIYHSVWVYQDAMIDLTVEHSAHGKLDLKTKILIPRKLFHNLGRHKSSKITSKAKDPEEGGGKKTIPEGLLP